jgi:hypothetical protein
MNRPAPHTIGDSGEVKKTALAIRELHAGGEKLNEEWLVLENVSGSTINVRGCVITVAENVHRRPHILGTLDPGFMLSPGGRIRLVTGSPARKAEGTPPAETEELKNYHLFLKSSYLQPGAVVRLTLRQLDMARAAYLPDEPNGVGAV